MIKKEKLVKLGVSTAILASMMTTPAIQIVEASEIKNIVSPLNYNNSNEGLNLKTLVGQRINNLENSMRNNYLGNKNLSIWYYYASECYISLYSSESIKEKDYNIGRIKNAEYLMSAVKGVNTLEKRFESGSTKLGRVGQSYLDMAKNNLEKVDSSVFSDEVTELKERLNNILSKYENGNEPTEPEKPTDPQEPVDPPTEPEEPTNPTDHPIIIEGRGNLEDVYVGDDGKLRNVSKEMEYKIYDDASWTPVSEETESVMLPSNDVIYIRYADTKEEVHIGSTGYGYERFPMVELDYSKKQLYKYDSMCMEHRVSRDNGETWTEWKSEVEGAFSNGMTIEIRFKATKYTPISDAVKLKFRGYNYDLTEEYNIIMIEDKNEAMFTIPPMYEVYELYMSRNGGEEIRIAVGEFFSYEDGDEITIRLPAKGDFEETTLTFIGK